MSTFSSTWPYVDMIYMEEKVIWVMPQRKEKNSGTPFLNQSPPKNSLTLFYFGSLNYESMQNVWRLKHKF